MTLHRRAPRRDDGERDIIAALRAAGAMVWPISAEGIPDLLVGHRGRWLFIEVKKPLGPRGGHHEDGQKLQPKQARFFHDAELLEAPAYVCRSPEEALRAIGLNASEGGSQ